MVGLWSIGMKASVAGGR